MIDTVWIINNAKYKDYKRKMGVGTILQQRVEMSKIGFVLLRKKNEIVAGYGARRKRLKGLPSLYVN